MEDEFTKANTKRTSGTHYPNLWSLNKEELLNWRVHKAEQYKNSIKGTER
jgi:hypothetical protein